MSRDTSATSSATEPAAPTLSVWSTLRELLGHMARYRTKALLLAGALVVAVGYDTLLPLSMKYLVDRAIAPRDMGAFVFILSILSVAFVVSVACAIGRDYLHAWLGAHVLHDFRTRMFGQLQQLSLDFYGRIRQGDLLSRFSTDLTALENVLVMGLPSAFPACINIVVSTAVLFALEWKLALLLFLALPFCLIGPRLLGPRALKAGYLLRNEQGVLTGLVQENVQAQRIVKAFSLKRSALARFHEQSTRILRTGVSFGFYSYSTERTPNIGMALFDILVLIVGGYLALKGQLSIGALVSFKALFLNVSYSVETLSAFVPSLLQATGGLQRIRELLHTPSRIHEQPGAVALAPFREAIRLEQVGFSYTGERRDLDAVTLEIPKGARVAFVGPSGCGKSTCLSIILRFFDPDQGRVSFDGKDLREVSVDSFYAQLGVVFQENFLFNASIRENIRLGRPDATDAEVEAVGRLTELHDLVMTLPQGYDTPVGEGGGRLSGGQRQRVAIARALIRQPAILVLDEATSALDPATESAINGTLEQLAGQQTTIVVTHRLDPLVRYEHIFVFRAGKLVEKGTHRELLAGAGLYAELWSKQHAVAFSEDGAHATVDPESLRRINIFRDLDETIRSQIAGLFLVEECSTGSVVFRQGDAGDKFYVIARGRVRVSALGSDGTERDLAVLEDGDNFGEVAVLEDAPRNATVTAESPTMFLTLRRAAFQKLLDRNPTIRAAIREQTERRRGAAVARKS